MEVKQLLLSGSRITPATAQSITAYRCRRSCMPFTWREARTAAVGPSKINENDMYVRQDTLTSKEEKHSAFSRTDQSHRKTHQAEGHHRCN